MKSSLLVLWTAAFIAAAGCPAWAAQPFELRGIPLGITLSQFRGTPDPDAAESSAPVKVICTGDTENITELEFLSDDETTAHVVACGFYSYTSVVDMLPPRWEAAPFHVATVGVYATFKFVAGPGASEPRLYQIEIRSNPQYWEKFWNGFTGKYGKPTSVSNEPTQNQAGASFDNTEAVWDNGISAIRLIKRFVRIDNTYIFYEDKRLTAQVSRAVESVKGRPQDNL